MIIHILLLVVVFFAALAWGANEPWAMAIIIMATLALFFVKLAVDIWNNRGFSIAPSPLYIPMALFLLYVGLQLTVRPIPPIGFPGTVESHTTWIYFLLAASYAAAFFIIANGPRSRDALKWLIAGILVLGMFQAVYGLIQYLADYNYIWHFRRHSHGSVASGTFINRNHYALLMNMCIAAACGYLYFRAARLIGGRGFSLRRLVSAPGAGKLAWIALCIVLMALALIFSLSRMGIAALFVSIIVMAVFTGGAGRRFRTVSLVALLLLAAILGSALYVGVDAILIRYEQLSAENQLEHSRFGIWRDAWEMFGNYPLFGQGFGTFRWIYPEYESIQPDTPAEYAHNNYLQALIEVGVIGTALLLWAFAAAWRVAIKNLKSSDPLISGIGIGTIGALTAIMFQEFTDFGLYIPGVALTAAFLIGINSYASTLKNNKH
ncbi:MAG TPA: O-antigen ligase family protein [Acidobacteriota bacterium]|nr:O-antigen ligase family protein [Acidobacteriota bacterium]